MNNKDIPKAFPGEEGPYKKLGMDLRDWFAGQALNGLISLGKIYNGGIENDIRMSYKIADRMMEERLKNKTTTQ